MHWYVKRMTVLAVCLSLVFSVGVVLESDAASRKASNPCAAKRMNPCNPCAAKANPCNPCAAKRMNPCNPCAAKNPCNPCSPGAARAAQAKARMIIGQVVKADARQLAVRWQDQTLHIGVHDKTQYTRGRDEASPTSIVPGERIIVSMLDRGGDLSANYVYLAQAQAGNPCNPCAAKNPCNPCAAKKMNPCNPCAAKANPCNPCAAKKMNPCNPCAAKNPCNPCAAKKNPCNPCGAKKKW